MSWICVDIQSILWLSLGGLWPFISDSVLPLRWTRLICILSAYLLLDKNPQKWQVLIYLPSSVCHSFMCDCILRYKINLWQISHSTGGFLLIFFGGFQNYFYFCLIFVWTQSMCVWSESLLAATKPHMWHFLLFSLSSECQSLMCNFSFGIATYFPQISHGTLGVCTYSIWAFSLDLFDKNLPHYSHATPWFFLWVL